jgi:tRNA 2-thiouridine synthesizing protein A
MAEVKASSQPGRYILDVKGYACPYPQYYAIKALHGLSKGDFLEVILDNQPSLEIVQDTAKKNDCRVISVDKVEGNVLRILIQK